MTTSADTYTTTDWNRDYEQAYAEAMQRFGNQGAATIANAHSRYVTASKRSTNGGVVGYIVALADLMDRRAAR